MRLPQNIEHFPSIFLVVVLDCYTSVRCHVILNVYGRFWHNAKSQVLMQKILETYEKPQTVYVLSRQVYYFYIDKLLVAYLLDLTVQRKYFCLTVTLCLM